VDCLSVKIPVLKFEMEDWVAHHAKLEVCIVRESLKKIILPNLRRFLMNEYWFYGILLAGMLVIAYLRMKKKQRVYRRMPDREFPDQWQMILEKRVPFYQRLSSPVRKDFEKKIHIFLLNYKIAGADIEITDLDRVLIAAGAVIPTFRLEKWHYTKLEQIVVFPERFQIPETDQKASGLVGWGEMEGQMWLSRKALYKGFHIDNDNKNVAIHEFIHLMDMQDGLVDGVLEELMEEADIEPWLQLVKDKSEKIGLDHVSIREYAKANPVEFLATTGEYYFESPNEMRSAHPELYRALDKIFNPKANWF
jgi:Mlc titration factor MtfA (ptsG expression regulator)